MDLELFLFCRSDVFDECMLILSEKLTKKSQIEYYDFIYDNVVTTFSIDDFDENIIVKGLENIIKLIILSQIYKSNKHTNNFHYNIMYEIFKRENYSLKEFISTVCFLCRNEENYLDEKILFKLPKNHFCFPYVLVHKAGNLSFESLTNMIFGHCKYSKIPISFKLFSDEDGPHLGYFNTPYSFFLHDYGHFLTSISQISKYNMDLICAKNKLLINNSFEKRCIMIYLNLIIFENTEVIENLDYKYLQLDPFENFDTFDQIIFNEFDIADVHHLIKYLIESYDINSYTENYENLILNYLDFKNNWKIPHFLKEISKDEIYEEKHNYFDIQKYSEIINIQNNDDIHSIRKKLTKLGKKILKEFITNNLTPLFQKL